MSTTTPAAGTVANVAPSTPAAGAVDLCTVSVRAVDGTKRAFDLPTDGLAAADVVRAYNASARRRLMSASNVDAFRADAKLEAHKALESGRDAMSAQRAALLASKSIDKAAHLKAILKLAVKVNF